MRLPKLVIFDWDGTLVDSIDSILTGFRHAYRRHGHPCPPETALKATIGLPLAAAFEAVSPGLPTATMVTLYREYWFDPGRPTSPWINGATETLDWLSQRNIRCAIATGKSRQGAELELTRLQAESRFATLKSSDCAAPKPHPEMLQQILRELEIDPSEAMMVGDSPLDLRMARAAKVPAIGVLGGVGSAQSLHQEQPLAVMTTVAELPQRLTVSC